MVKVSHARSQPVMVLMSKSPPSWPNQRVRLSKTRSLGSTLGRTHLQADVRALWQLKKTDPFSGWPLNFLKGAPAARSFAPHPGGRTKADAHWWGHRAAPPPVGMLLLLSTISECVPTRWHGPATTFQVVGQRHRAGVAQARSRRAEADRPHLPRDHIQWGATGLFSGPL